MTRFDLTFKGTILPDHDPQAVKNGFAELFTIKDPFVLEQLFSGETFVVRSNLDRKSAADYFRKVVELGGQAELVASDKVDETDIEHADHPPPQTSASDHPVGGRNGEILVKKSDHIDQSWPVSAGPNNFIAPPVSDDPTERERAAEEERLRAELTELRMARDSAEAAAASELARLQQEQDKAREQYEKELAQVCVMQEQASEKGNGLLDALQKKVADTQRLRDSEIEQLERNLQEKNEEAEQAMESLMRDAGGTEKELLEEAKQLEQDKLDTARKAEESIAKLEQLIAETRRQAELDLGELDTLLEANQGALEAHKESFSGEHDDIVHQSAEDSDLLQAQLEKCREESDALLTRLAQEQEQEREKARESVAQLEEMEGEIELRWSGELGRLQQQVQLTQRKLESELESLAADEVSLRHELTRINS